MPSKRSTKRIIARIYELRPTRTPSYALAALCEEMALERMTLQQALNHVAGAYSAAAVWRAHGRRAAAAAFLDIPESQLHTPGSRMA